MRKFMALLKKELRELITPQVLVPMLVVIVMFVAIGQILSDVGAKQSGASPVLVVDLDKGPYSGVVTGAMKEAGFRPVLEKGGITAASRTSKLADAEVNILVQIPAGFSAALEAGRPQQIETLARVKNFSLMGNSDISKLSAALEGVNAAVAAKVAEKAAPGTDARMFKQPIEVKQAVMVGDKVAETSVMEVMGFVTQQTTFIPVVLFLVILMAAQMIATAIATEKENKTLETLLSYPVSRASIVTSKMVAAGIVALMSAAAYMIGMQQYMNGVTKGVTDGMGATQAAVASQAVMLQLGLTLGVGDYLLLGLTLFAGILVALAMAIILGAFAESVKSVQTLITPLMVLLLVPYFLSMFLDLSVLPTAARIAVMAIPFTYPFITGPNLFLGNYGVVWFGIGYQLLWFVGVAVVAARIFSSDRVLTMKLSLKKKRP